MMHSIGRKALRFSTLLAIQTTHTNSRRSDLLMTKGGLGI